MEDAVLYVLYSVTSFLYLLRTKYVYVKYRGYINKYNNYIYKSPKLLDLIIL